MPIDIGDGGLGLQHLKSKALAHLIATFLQTACNKNFQQSQFDNWLYNYHVEENTDLPDPGFPPFYNREFFKSIKNVKKDTPLNPVNMSVTEWYRLLLEKFMTMRPVD